MFHLSADSARCTYDEAPSIPFERALTHTVRPDSRSGLDPEARPVTPASSHAISFLFIIFLAAVIFNLRYTRRMFSTFTSDVFGLRRRKNIFEETTAYETRSIIILAIQFCLSGAILLYLTVAPPELGLYLTSSEVNSITLLLAGISMGWYLLHIVGYTVIGQTFASPEATKDWVRVFNLSMAIFTIASILPIASALYLPHSRHAMYLLIAVIFAISTLFPIIKGFRIFYTNIFSILYFILYLCTLEIIPVIVVYAAARRVIFYLYL